jgi:hypothetical protein
MKYSKRKYRDKSIEVIEEVVVTKKKKKKVLKEGFFKKMIKKVKSFFKRK